MFFDIKTERLKGAPAFVGGTKNKEEKVMRKIPGCNETVMLANIRPKLGMITAFTCNNIEASGLFDWQEKAKAPARFYSLTSLVMLMATGDEGTIIYETPFIFATSVMEFEAAEWQLWKKGLIADGDHLYELFQANARDCGFLSLYQFGPF